MYIIFMANYYGYARVSTKDQSDYSLENQLTYLKIKAEELKLPFVGYSEKISGKSFSNRPKLQEIKENAKAGDYLGVYDNSRLGRDTQEALSTVDEFISKGVIVQISGEILDSKIPRERLIFTVESAISEFHRLDQNLKSRVGIDQKKKSGEWLFTSRLFGYELSFQGNQPFVEVVEEEAEAIRYLFTEYARGKSIRKITQELNSKGYRTRSGKIFHDASVRRYIHKPIYKGYYKLEGAGRKTGQDKKPLGDSKLVKSKYYPAIVSPELWDNVQKSYKTLRRKHTKQFEYRYSHYELTSILRCQYCKELGKATSYVHQYYKSQNSNRINENYVNRIHLKGCKQKYHTFRAWILESIFRNCFYLVFANLTEVGDFVSQQRSKVADYSKNIQDDIARIDRQLETIIREKANLIDAVQKGLPYEDVQQRLESLENQNNELIKHKTTLENSYWEAEEEFERLSEEYSESMLLTYLHADKQANRRKIYQELIEYAYVYEERIVITYTNSKKFIIPLRKNNGRKVQKVFDIDIYFMEKYQYSVMYNADNEEISLRDVNIEFSVNSDRDKLFRDGIIKRREQEINSIKCKVEELKSVQTINNN
jgi:site-specific DNA recombinase